MAKSRSDDDGDEDDRPRRKRSKSGALSGIIPYRNGMALTAYYCGFSGADDYYARAAATNVIDRIALR